MTTKTVPRSPDRAMRADARRNRQRVLSAARKCMARDGLEAQMEEIARCAKVGVGTVYRHFPNKEDLVEALAADRFERLAGLAEAALDREDPGPAFDDFVRASARIQSEDRALSEVLTSRPETMRRAAEGVGMLALVAEVHRPGAGGRGDPRRRPSRGHPDADVRARRHLPQPQRRSGALRRDRPRRPARPGLDAAWAEPGRQSFGAGGAADTAPWGRPLLPGGGFGPHLPPCRR